MSSGNLAQLLIKPNVSQKWCLHGLSGSPGSQQLCTSSQLQTRPSHHCGNSLLTTSLQKSKVTYWKVSSLSLVESSPRVYSENLPWTLMPLLRRCRPIYMSVVSCKHHYTQTLLTAQTLYILLAVLIPYLSYCTLISTNYPPPPPPPPHTHTHIHTHLRTFRTNKPWRARGRAHITEEEYSY